MGKTWKLFSLHTSGGNSASVQSTSLFIQQLAEYTFSNCFNPKGLVCLFVCLGIFMKKLSPTSYRHKKIFPKINKIKYDSNPNLNRHKFKFNFVIRL